MSIENLITDHIETWTTAQVQRKSGGRGRSKKSNGQSQYGIKKLRELILDLAVRGKLVPQDLNDEPASVLLDKITVEKARLIKDGKIKKHKPVPKIDGNEAPYELPNCWKWVRVGDIGYGLGQKTPTSNFTYIDVSSINNTIGRVESPGMLTASEAPSRARKIVKVGTVIYSTVRPYLQNICVIDERYNPEPIASTAFAILHPFQQMPGKFLSLYLRSPVFVKYVESVQTGIAYPAINDKQFTGGLFPLPPLAEQRRIVTKVDELMALCDQLEQEQTDNTETHQLLVKTLLDILTKATDHADFIESWQRIEANFDILFTTEASIDKLKQTILQLAVMGKLVPQDPNDEPASVLLKKIAAEKARLVKTGKIKKQKVLPKISEDEKPFELPAGHVFSRLQETIDVRDGTHDSPKDSEGKDTFPLVTSKNFLKGEIDFNGARRISAEDHYNIAKRSNVEVHDILFSMIGGNLGNQVIVKDSRPFSVKNVALFKYYSKSLTLPLFVKIFMEHLALNLQSQAAGGAQPFVSLGFLRKIVIGLPPLNEQHRIIAKVKELMALCNSLKEQLSSSQNTQVQLADAIVSNAVH